MSLTTTFDSVARDFRHALRTLPRRPSFTLAAVLTLALGIGATTAIFSVVYSVLIKPLPYPNSGELVSIKAAAPGLNTDDLGIDQTMLLTYRDEGRTFVNLGLWDQRSATLTERGEATRVPILRVADGTLQTLGVQPLHGRWFTEQESYGPPAAGLQSVILSYAFWQRRFGSDPDIVGKTILLNDNKLTIVGVMPATFSLNKEVMPTVNGVQRSDVFLPISISDADRTKRGGEDYNIFAKLKPGVTVAQAQANMDQIAEQMKRPTKAHGAVMLARFGISQCRNGVGQNHFCIRLGDVEIIQQSTVRFAGA